MGPKRAAQLFLDKHHDADKFVVTLYGSLAATGKGHLTDAAILDVLSPAATTTIEWQPNVFLPFHPNAVKFESYNRAGDVTDSWTVYSIGGGTLSDGTKIIGLDERRNRNIYYKNKITDILQWCKETGKTYWEYVEECEDSDIWDYLSHVWQVMSAAVKRGLESEGVLPGPLALTRKASTYYIKAKGYKDSLQSRGLEIGRAHV